MSKSKMIVRTKFIDRACHWTVVICFFHAEGTAFIQQRKFQQYRASVRDIKRTLFFCFWFHVTHSFLNIHPWGAFIVFALPPGRRPQV